MSFDPTVREHGAVDGEVVERLRGMHALEAGELVMITKGDLAGVRGGTNAMKIVSA
ncbi:MAG: hypothetical protein U5L11_12145 [Arhodomonas sp.]|nr:hypothetical protein [Arhodomonas sp.]